MRTIVITNQKGGCGKTTTAVNLAAALAQIGQKVLMLDLDPQAHASLGLGCKPETCKRTIYHSLAQKQIPISKITINTEIPGLDLAPSSILLAKAEQELAAVSRKEFILANQLEAVSSKYDVCVIDCPPSLGLLTFSALVASTDVIVPVQVHYYALEGLKQLLETVKTARKRFYPCSVKILGILLTFVEGKAALSLQVEQQMRAFFGDLVFDTVIHRTMSLAEAPSAGVSISAYAPQSKGAAEYRTLAEEVANGKYKRKRKVPTDVEAIVDHVQIPSEAGGKAEAPAIAEEHKKAERQAKALAEAENRLKAEVGARARAEELARREAQARVAVADREQKKAREYAEALDEVEKKLKAEVEARSRAEEEAQVEAQRRAEAEQKANAEAVELARLEAKARAALKHTPQTPSRVTATIKKLAFLFISTAFIVAAVVGIVYLINMTNTAPLAEPVSARVAEDTATAITLAASDLDGDQLSYRLVTNPSHGTLSGTGPALTYSPQANYSGPDSFTYTVSDGVVDSNSATVSITVAAVDDVPKANDQSAMTKVDRSASIILTGSDIDSETLSFVIATQPKHGTLAFGSDFARNGKLLYTPETRYTGSDSFAFKMNDGTTDSTPATVSINVTPNHIPMAEPQAVVTAEDAPDVITLGGSDPDRDTLVYSVVTGPAHGALSGTAPNLTYTPNRDFHGPDSFTFKVNDGAADSPLATVSITITAVNDPPIAANDHVTTPEDTSRTIFLRGIDPDGNRLTYSIVTEPSHGSLSGTEPNVVYEPDQDFNGPDSFTFRISDGTTDSVPATISIMVIGTADAPIANDDSVTVQEDEELPIILTGSDPDGDPLTFAVLRNPAHGTLTGKAPNVVYTPDPNFSWMDSFTFRVSDGTAESPAATVRISVTPVNDPPKAHDDSLVTQEDTPATIDVLANDIEVDNELLKITAVGKSAGGSVTVNPTGTLTYTPNADFYGKDTFTYIVTDREGMTDRATVRVEVTSANDAPLITSKPVIAAMVGVQYRYDVEARDPDRTDELTYSLTSRPSGMTIESATGLIRWTPTEGQEDETFAVAVKVTDSLPASDVQQYEVRVKPTPPKAAALTVADAYDHNTNKRLSADGRIDAIKASDDKRIEGGYGSAISYSFSKVTIPPGAKVAKVMLYVEHYEDESFPLGKLKWEIGKGWPDNPTVWFAGNATIRKGKQKEATDSWDITSFGNTAEKVNALQLRIENTDSISRKKTFVNHIRVLVEWDWPVSKSSVGRGSRSRSKDEPDDGLVLIRR